MANDNTTSAEVNGGAQFAEARGSAIRDEFRGDNVLLRDCIKALINLNDDNALVPHGIGGHARNLLAACYHRLPNNRIP